MLGHTSIKTTQIYAKILDTKVMDDMAALKEMYARKESQESPSNKAAISEQKMGKALNDALQHYGNVEGHRSIVLKGWIIKTIYALKSNQLNDLDRIAFKYIKNEY